MSTELASWGSDGYPTKMLLKTYKGRRFIDLRKHFQGQPTRKGIMLSGAHYASMLDGVLLHADRIARWFAEEADAVADRVESFQALLRDTRRREAATLHDTEVSVAPSAGNSLFEIEFLGADVEVKLNETHPLVRALDTAVSEGDQEGVRHLLGAVLQSSFHAVALTTSDDESANLEAAEQHAHLLAMLLAQVRPARP